MNLALALFLLAGPDYPKQTGIVNDFAGILDPDSKSKIESSSSSDDSDSSSGGGSFGGGGASSSW